MDIQKPDTLFCATQPLDWRGAPHHAFSALLGLDMRTSGVLAADAALTAAMQALPSGCRLDVGIPKQEAEWLLAGVVTPRAREGAVVEIRVGRSRRRFLVTASPDGSPVPLIWEKTAFDPEGNPLGGKNPQISDPALPHGAPACPLPLGAWPCRMKNMGTYDARWLKTRWPGLPDDADWRFFNEAQPQQRLPDGLRGDEEILLAGFFDDAPERRFRLPGAHLRFEILRREDNAWKEHAARADTLWLFPVQNTALLYWHALVPCADEAASDIAAVRFHLSPDTLESAPPAPFADAVAPAGQTTDAPAPDMGAAVATAAGMTAAAAVATSAATAGASDSDREPAAASAETPSSPASEAASSDIPTAPPPAASDTPIFSPAALSATMREKLTEDLPEINAALEEAGLPPLSPEQIEETQRHIDALTAKLAEVEDTPPPPPLEEQLRQAGVPEDRIAAVNAALELELPDPTRHADSASWQAASDAFLASFSALLQPDEELRASMSRTLQLLGPDGEKQLKALAGDMADSPQALLQRAGMRPDNAERLLTMLEQAPDEPDELDAYARELEMAAGFPPDSISGHLQRYRDALRELEGESPAAPESSKPKAPEESGTTAASDAAPATATASEEQPPQSGGHAAEAEAATADTTPDNAAPLSRAAVMALLASGASLAGVVLAGADLSGLRFDKQNLAGADFSGANLRGASFVDADLSEASLEGADAADAVFLRTRLDKARLRQLRAADADFTGATLAGADAPEADFSGATFQESQAADLHAADAVFTNARLRDADFSGADLSGACLTGTDMHALKLDRARLSGANLAAASLNNDTRAPGADFSGAALGGSVWSGVAAPQAVFQRAAADNASFIDCDFSGTGWDAVRARHADFTRCSLRGASLQRADLFEASLREARLHAADIRNANLYGADLYRLGTDDATRLDGAHIARTILAARGK